MIFEKAKAEFDWAESKNNTLSTLDQQRAKASRNWKSYIPAALAIASLIAFVTAYVVTR